MTPDRGDVARATIDAFERSQERDATQSLGHTSHTFVVDSKHGRHVVKTLRTRGPYRWLGRYFLRREYQAYQRLSDVPGTVPCLGFVDDTYLVVEWVAGEPLQRTYRSTPEDFLSQLQNTIAQLHERGVAHGDLKEKGNIVVTPELTPVLIDFGTAVCLKDGFHPLNRLAFKYMCRLDNHAFLKHQDRVRRGVVARQEKMAYRATPLEFAAKAVREGLKWLTRGYKNF